MLRTLKTADFFAIAADNKNGRQKFEIINVLAYEKILDEKGINIPEKLNSFVLKQYRNGYYVVGKIVGQVW